MLWLFVSMALGTAEPGALDRARAQEEAGDVLAAIATLERAVAGDPLWVLARLELGRLRLAQGVKTDAALQHLDVARSLAPENPRAHYLFALAAEENRAPVQSRRALEVALALRPGYADAQYRLAGLLMSEGANAEAARLLQQFIAKQPAATDAKLLLATAQDRAGDYAGAEATLRELFALPGLKVVAGRRLAGVLDRQGRHAEADRVRAAIDPPKKPLRPLLPSKR
jgi:tetratricopeptide (TPR) repeat protein